MEAEVGELCLANYLTNIPRARMRHEGERNNRPLRKYHNTLYLFPQILHTHCFQFLLGITMVPRENKNNAYAKCGRQTKSIMVFSELAYCFSKIQPVGKKISRLNNFRKLKLDFNPPLPPKHYKHGGAFRY